MGREKQNQQQRRWCRDPNLRKDSQECHRRQQRRRTWTTWNKMDQDRMPTEKHSNRGLLRTPRKWERGKGEGNFCSPQPANRAENKRMWHHISRRFQRKTGNIQGNLYTDRIQKRKNAPGNDKRIQSTPSKPKCRPWNMDQNQQENKNRKVNHRQHHGIPKNNKRDNHHDCRRKGHLRVRGKNETDHNTLLMTLKINYTRKPTYINKWNLDNNEGWKSFNNKVAEAANQHHITQGTYDEAIKRII